MKILYVEDDPFDADLTRRALLKTAPHFSLEIARNTREALKFLQDTPTYDLLLTDLRLPDGSGMSLLAHVRERHLPMAVVVITGQGDEEIAVSALKAGANDYLVKRQDYLDHLSLTLEAAHNRYQAEAVSRERPVRVIYIENDPLDIEAVCRHFSNHAHHIHLQVVTTTREVLTLLPANGADPECDALMLDYHQQDMTALDLLKELRQVRRLDLPIVLVTAQGDEELAVQALRLGAYDYVVKTPGYLFRLPGLLENAYHRYQLTREQAALRLSEERFRRLAENAPDIIYRIRTFPAIAVEYISPAVQPVTGYTPEELYAIANASNLIHPDDWGRLQEALAAENFVSEPMEFRIIRKDGRVVWAEGRNTCIWDDEGRPATQEGIIRDITERKQAEERIQRQILRLNALRSIDAAITANLSLTQTLDVLLKHVVDQLGVDAAAILMGDPQNQQLRMGISNGFRISPVAIQARAAWSRGPAGRAAVERRTIRAERASLPVDDRTLVDLWTAEGFEMCFAAPLLAKRQVMGVLGVFTRSPFEPDGEWINFLETLAGQAAIAIENADLVQGLQNANQELLDAYDTTLAGWVQALDLRDKETEEHTQRVTDVTLRLARVMGIDEAQLIHIRRGALLHDIGKVGIPDGILLKPGPLTDTEREIMRLHPVYARQLLSNISYLHQAMDIPYYHHERWDGTGYPTGLKGEDIPLSARIFAVVDVWDALSSDRPYRQAWEKDKVISHIRAERGKHFDPQVVDAFLQLIEE